MTLDRATPLATAVDLRRYRTASDADVAARLSARYGQALARLPAGPSVLRGLPFRFARSNAARRWILLDQPVTIDLRTYGAVSHIVVAHFCDAWQHRNGDRPSDLPIGWVTPVGQPLARYGVRLENHEVVDLIVRRRFEINEGIVGWGQGAFSALPHQVDRPLDWRGPYPAQVPARYTDPGQAGMLGTLPGTWGPAQTGVADSVPSPTDDIVLWLHAIDIPAGPLPLRDLVMEPLASIDEGGGVVVAGITVFRGTASPLAVEPRRSLRVESDAEGIMLDLGQVFRRRPAPARRDNGDWPAGPMGWGTAPVGDAERSIVVELAMAPDAAITVGGEVIPANRLPDAGSRRFGTVTVEPLPTPTRRIDVSVVDAATDRPVAARIHFHAEDGRYLAPLGHRDEINPGLNEDTGADVHLGEMSYAYVSGAFPIDLPASRVHIEAVRGFGFHPIRRTIDVASLTGPLIIPLERVDGAAEGWVAADCHVHFISPTSALLQARAEGVALVNLLATQWGDHHTSIADLPIAALADPIGEHIVVMGSENRQNLLGHIGLLGAHEAVLPMASAGSPEARLGDPLDVLIADWADAARAQRGLALAVHFPLPYAEVAADIVSGRIDAVEMQALTADVDGPSIREWYRFLNCGYRLPIVGGTDKMSAEIPLGAIRTYARLDRDRPLSFDTWADAVRAGRTFVSSGSFIDLRVEGCEPGEEIRLGRGGGSVDVVASASAAQAVIDRLEIIHDGSVVAATASREPSDQLTLSERIRVTKSGWLAARVTSREQIHSAFSTSMGAHSSPVYVHVPGRPAFSAEDADVIGTIIDGARTWVERIAPVRSAERRRLLVSYFEESRARLDERIRDHSR